MIFDGFAPFLQDFATLFFARPEYVLLNMSFCPLFIDRKLNNFIYVKYKFSCELKCKQKITTYISAMPKCEWLCNALRYSNINCWNRISCWNTFYSKWRSDLTVRCEARVLEMNRTKNRSLGGLPAGTMPIYEQNRSTAFFLWDFLGIYELIFPSYAV